MGVKIYRKSNLQIVSSVPSGVSPERDFELNVGGNLEDYDFIEVTTPFFHLEIQDGQVVVIEDTPPPQEVLPQSKSELEIIGEQLVQKDLEVMQLQADSDQQGKQLVDMDIRLMMGGL